jgi:hypothetical protein
VSGDLVLDTSVVVAARRGVPGAEARFDQAERLWLPLKMANRVESLAHLPDP